MSDSCIAHIILLSQHVEGDTNMHQHAAHHTHHTHHATRTTSAKKQSEESCELCLISCVSSRCSATTQPQTALYTIVIHPVYANTAESRLTCLETKTAAKLDSPFCPPASHITARKYSRSSSPYLHTFYSFQKAV